MAGATTPSTIAGAIGQATAECLAGLVYVNAVRPGHPAIFGTWPFGLDLRSGAMTGASGEQALLTAGESDSRSQCSNRDVWIARPALIHRDTPAACPDLIVDSICRDC